MRESNSDVLNWTTTKASPTTAVMEALKNLELPSLSHLSTDAKLREERSINQLLLKLSLDPSKNTRMKKACSFENRVDILLQNLAPALLRSTTKVEVEEVLLPP
jgi:hypothetical protein